MRRSITLLELYLPVWSQSECAAAYARRKYPIRAQLCQRSRYRFLPGPNLVPLPYENILTPRCTSGRFRWTTDDEEQSKEVDCCRRSVRWYRLCPTQHARIVLQSDSVHRLDPTKCLKLEFCSFLWNLFDQSARLLVEKK